MTLNNDCGEYPYVPPREGHVTSETFERLDIRICTRQSDRVLVYMTLLEVRYE